jgi:hypothetical protein
MYFERQIYSEVRKNVKENSKSDALILILAVVHSGALAVTADFGYGATSKTSKK